MSTGPSEHRRCDSLFIPTSIVGWLDDRVSTLIESATNRFSFATDEPELPMQLLRYKRDDYIRPHVDSGSGARCRKISFTVQLSRPDEYAGGDLRFIGNDARIPFGRELGAATIFPSFMLHEVSPVAQGERFALVFWVHGPAFR